MAIRKKQQINTVKELQENRLRYFTQILNIKQDSGMTRIYTACCLSTEILEQADQIIRLLPFLKKK